MRFSNAAVQEAAHRIRQAERVLIVSHIRPDGDAVGSLLGLGLALEQTGNQVQMVIEDGIPPSLRHLEGSQQVRRRPDGIFDLTVVVDSSDLGRTGNVFNDIPGPDLNIDHHKTNPGFATINLVDDEASATSEIIAELLPVFGLELTQPVAAALITGIITDTLGFRTSNIRPHTLELAAKLMQTGVDMPDLYRRALVVHSFEAVKLWGSGLNKLERENRIVWTTLTMSDRKEVNYPGRDDADLINILSSIEDTDISIIFVEQPNGNIKVSWRAQPGCDVSNVALAFGGGGHPAASGAEISGSLTEVTKAVLETTRLLTNGGHRVKQ